MFGYNKGFRHKTIGKVDQYTSYSDLFKNFFSINGFFKIIVVILCLIFVFYVGKYVINFTQATLGKISKGTVGLISQSIGEDMKTDEFGNINVVFVGYGGAGHAGSYLTDSIIIASLNPKLGAVSMISIPRDLYVFSKQKKISGRINEIFSHGISSKHQFATGANLLIDILEDISGLKIHYYALVDFDGFKDFIDSLGGITIDVPKPITDNTYPTENNGYMTFHVNSGVNNFSGETALMYARSRHSTSDFSRSLRQQQIIKAVIDKLMKKGWISNISRVKQLYSQYTKTVNTNISLKEIIGMVKNIYSLKHIFSYGFTTECSNINYNFSFPGCFLYTPPRELFAGASVMIPDGGEPNDVAFYKYTQNFSFFVAHNQEYLIENPKIFVMNGIDKNFAKQTLKKSEGFANQLAVKLRKYAFNILNVENFTQVISGTTIYVLGTGNYNYTIKTLKNFVNVDEVINQVATGMIDQFSGADLLLVLGNGYVQNMVGKGFNYYK
ncbi:MAG: LCP family protein [Candidatus Absconditabacterales bacterium]